MKPTDKPVQLALALQRLGVSQAGAAELLSYPHDRIERQLAYLPFRKAKRPEALIVEAIRQDFSAPKEFFYAKNKTARAEADRVMDEDAQLPRRQAPSVIEGYGTATVAPLDPPDHRLEPGGEERDLVLPDAVRENRQEERSDL